MALAFSCQDNPGQDADTLRIMKGLSLRQPTAHAMRQERSRGIVRAVGVIAFSALGLAPVSAFAQETAADVKKQIETKRIELDKARSKAKSLQRDVEQIAKDQGSLTGRLQETAALIQKSEGRLTEIESKLGGLHEQEKIVRGSLSQRHGEIATLLSALQRMGRNPPPVMITRREDALAMVRSAMLLSSAFPGLRKQALVLTGRLNELVRVMTDIKSEKARLEAETERLTSSQTRLASLMQQKKLSLDQRQSELREVRVAVAEIRRNVSNLDELIFKLDRTVTEKTGLGAYDKENRIAAKLPNNVAQAPAPPLPGAKPGKETQVAALAPEKEPSVIELAPSGPITGRPSRMKPAIPFFKAKARLPLPAQGKRMLSFGEKTQYGSASKGLVLETRRHAQITSPSDGWVVYAGQFRSYGQLLIINAGGGYHILLAGLSRIDVQPGQFVLAAEPVGKMSGVPGPKSGQSEAGKPVLYVEFRKDGRPINPDPWWVAGQKKVQG